MKLAPEQARAIAPVAERALKRWILATQIGERAAQHALGGLLEEVHPYVAVSRETGTEGEAIGQRAAAALGGECLGSELLTFVAKRCDLPKRIIELVDETSSDWLQGVFRRWLEPRVITQDEYVTRVGQAMLLAARHGRAVFVGRGAQFLLPRERGLAVRIIAPLERRIERIMTSHGLDRVTAADHVRQTDQGRRDFVRQHFRRDVADPQLYDITINTAHMSPDAAAALIVEGFRQRFASATSPATSPTPTIAGNRHAPRP